MNAARRPAARRGARLPLVAAVVGAATVAAGPILGALGVELGVRHAPFFVQLAPVVTWYLLPALFVLAAAILASRRLARPGVRPLWFAAGALAVTFAVRLALNAARGGPEAWYAVFGSGWEAQFEYLPALPALRLGTVTFLDRFAELSTSLPIHPSAHPPGMVLTLALLGIRTAEGMAALTIGMGALAAPLVYVLARGLLDEARARAATLFFAFAPSSLLYGATSADALFATLGVAAAAALVSRRLVTAVGAPLLWLSSFFSYALTGVAAWAVLVVAGRRGLAAATRLAILCGAALLAGYVLLYALTGFDLFGTLEAANAAYVRGISSQRPYWYWLVGSPTAFFVALGLPLAWLVLRGAGRGETTALALATVVALAALLGFTKAENERIWLFLVPLACVAAAAEARQAVTPILAALAAQALLVQVLLDTWW